MKLKEILKMLSILVMYILVFGLTYLTYIVVSLSDSRIFTETFMKHVKNKMLNKKAILLLSVAHAFYITLFMVCVMIASTSFGWAFISTIVFYFGIKYSRRAFNNIIDKVIEEQV